MRVLFYSHDAELYGASRSLLNLIEGLRMHGVEGHVILPNRGNLEGELDKKGIQFSVIPHSWWVSQYKPQKGSSSISSYTRWIRSVIFRSWKNITALRPHLELMKGLNPDIVYTNTSVIPMGALASMVLKKKHVWHLREFKDIDHGLHLDFGNGSFRFLARTSAALIFISHALRAYYAGLTDPSKCFVVHNGIAFQSEYDERSRAAKKVDGQSSPYTFGIVGHIIESKGQHVALRALSSLVGRHPETRLVIAGSGNHNGLKRLISELHLERNVELMDFVKDPYEVYNAIDAYLMCSRNEAFGRVTTEAMSAALPVIGNDSAGTSEILRHEHTGLLYRDGPEELAGAMERFIQDPSWARQLGINGWKYARENFNIERYAADVYGILQGVHQGNPPV